MQKDVRAKNTGELFDCYGIAHSYNLLYFIEEFALNIKLFFITFQK